MESNRSVIPLAELSIEGDDYREVLALGTLHEMILPSSNGGSIGVSFASTATFAAVAADLLLRDAALRERLLFSTNLASRVESDPGLQAALAWVIDYDLQRNGPRLQRLNLEQGGSHVSLLAAALLRDADASNAASLMETLRRLLANADPQRVEAIVMKVLSDGNSLAHPRGAAVLAEAALHELPIDSSASLLRLAVRCGGPAIRRWPNELFSRFLSMRRRPPKHAGSICWAPSCETKVAGTKRWRR